MKKCALLHCFVLFSAAAIAQGIKKMDSLTSVLRTQSDPDHRFATMNEILLAIDADGLPEADSTYVIEMLQIARQQNNDLKLATTYNWIGYNFYRLKGDNIAALEFYFKALPLAERSGDKRRISSLCFDIANVYTVLNNTEEAFNYTQRGGKNLPDTSHPLYYYMLTQFQRGMGTYYLKIGQFDSSLYFGQAMLQTSQRIKATVFRFNAKNLIATTYDKMGEEELAEIYFRKAQTDGDSIISGSRKNSYYKNYISFLIDNNRIIEAKQQSNEFWNLSKEYNNLNSLLLGAGFKRQIFERSKMLDSAYYYSRMEADLNDKIFNENNKNIIQSLAFKDRLRVIEENEKQAQARQQSRQNLQYIFITIGILTLIMLYLLLSHSFITNSKMIEFLGVIALLIVFEFLNLLLHPFLEKITDHNPILMLITLVMMAAMLIPLHHKLEKWATAKLVEKNRRIRLAVAKKTIQELEGGV